MIWFKHLKIKCPKKFQMPKNIHKPRIEKNRKKKGERKKKKKPINPRMKIMQKVGKKKVIKGLKQPNSNLRTPLHPTAVNKL